MENAAKALLIAAGILFAIIILGMFFLLSSNLNVLGEAEEAKIAAEQLTAFNAQYEAYNKRLLYGTEIITVARKAMENNIKVLAAGADEEHFNYINIEVELIQDFVKTITTITITDEGAETDRDNDTNIELSKGTHDLLDYDAELQDFFDPENHKDEKDIIEDEHKVIYTYSALTEFKRGIFTCEWDETEYKNGRISHLKFRQISTNTSE